MIVFHEIHESHVRSSTDKSIEKRTLVLVMIKSDILATGLIRYLISVAIGSDALIP